MAGLLSEDLQARVAPSQPLPDVQKPSMEEAANDDEGVNASPEEQAAYEDFVSDGLLLIYEDGKVRQSILDLLDEDHADLIAILGDQPELQEKSPVTALAATAVIVVLELVRRSGDAKPADEIIMHGGKAILEELADLAGEAKIHDFTQEEINKAWYRGMDLWRESASAEGLIDMEGLKGEFAEIQAADKEGRLGEVFGGQPEAVEIVKDGGGDGLRG